MALITKEGNYLRIEDLRLSKKLIQFCLREYSDIAVEPVSDHTLVIPYDLMSPNNPFIQAYEWVAAERYKDSKSDIEALIAPKKTRKVKA